MELSSRHFPVAIPIGQFVRGSVKFAPVYFSVVVTVDALLDGRINFGTAISTDVASLSSFTRPDVAVFVPVGTADVSSPGAGID